MRKLRAWIVRLFATLHIGRTRTEIDSELYAHIAMHTEDNLRAGLTSEEARRQALIQLGGEEQARQAYRDRATLPLLEGILQDVRFALRQMRKSPGFALTAILTLALGIGANAVIYTLVDSILLRPLPYADQDRLMRVVGENLVLAPKGWIRALGEQSHAFSSIAGYGDDVEFNLTDSDIPERVFGAYVTINALDTLGIHPAIGSFFNKDDEVAGQDNDVVLGYGYWQRHFAGAPSALGSTLRINGTSRRIIGVLPAGVRFPYTDTEFLIPVSYNRADKFDPWRPFDLHIFGRLAPGVASSQARAELGRLHNMLLHVFPWQMPDIWASDMTVVPLLKSETGDMRPRLLLLFGAVGLILLIACANVANMMLARATSREREIAIRGALGASSRRLIQQFLSESIVLGITAGVVGLAAAFASLRIFVRLLPAGTPRIENISLRPSDILFTLGASVLAGLLFGIIPSVRMASLNLLESLRLGSRGLVGKGRFGASTVLVVMQIALSVMVVTAAGLILHSLYKLSQVDPGFRTQRIVTAEVSLDSSACSVAGRCNTFFQTLLEYMSGIAGIDKVALADTLPLNGRDGSYVYDAEDHPRNAQAGASLATGRAISTGYFDLIGLRLVRGRLLTAQDASGATRAVVINEHMAERLWPHQNPIGKHLLDVNDEATPAVWDAAAAVEIVGVVRNTHDGNLDGDFADQVYLPITPTHEHPVMFALLRGPATPAESVSGLRRAVAGIDSSVPVTRVRTLNEVVASSVAAPRALAVLLLGFGALALIIGAVGVYSLIAYIVSWRVREIGLRLALGAQRWQIVMDVVRQSLLLAGTGCAAGIVATIALSRVLRSFLFEVGVFDPATLFAVPALMLLVALAAAWIPARRAAAVDPMVALRAD
ncbi:ADOP family duplicated permease [Terracidiphilus sp.]|jgi:predicted permease|uniref:ABC transporter permease n=1 Tax=Terracidiphilus sp. TaxID=1964191 RepID=UPI003C25AB68